MVQRFYENERTKITFHPVLAATPSRDFKIFLNVTFNEGQPQQHDYTSIGLKFTEFFDCYVMPTYQYQLRRGADLPEIGSSQVTFQSSATNLLSFRNFFELLRSKSWIVLRLHELIYLQLQFFPQKAYLAEDIDGMSGLPKQLKFI